MIYIVFILTNFHIQIAIHTFTWYSVKAIIQVISPKIIVQTATKNKYLKKADQRYNMNQAMYFE